ncbi:MAG: hypothetical protein SchgKO_19060 [Schleiferiaceae bacterium]
MTILPKTIDNEYRGNRLALYVFYAITAMTIVRSLIHLLATDGGAQSIATIPLDQYPEGAASSLIHIFSEWGLSQLIMGIFYLLVAVRYKSLVSLMYVFIFLEYSGRWILAYAKPLETLETAPGMVGNYIFVPLSLIMLYLSLPKEK